MYRPEAPKPLNKNEYFIPLNKVINHLGFTGLNFDG
jgi:hypothetical protein